MRLFHPLLFIFRFFLLEDAALCNNKRRVGYVAPQQGQSKQTQLTKRLFRRTISQALRVPSLQPSDGMHITHNFFWEPVTGPNQALIGLELSTTGAWNSCCSNHLLSLQHQQLYELHPSTLNQGHFFSPGLKLLLIQFAEFRSYTLSISATQLRQERVMVGST